MSKHNKSISEWFLVLLVVLSFESSTRWYCSCSAAAEEATNHVDQRYAYLCANLAERSNAVVQLRLPARFGMPAVEFIIYKYNAYDVMGATSGEMPSIKVGCHERKWTQQAVAQMASCYLAACQRNCMLQLRRSLRFVGASAPACPRT